MCLTILKNVYRCLYEKILEILKKIREFLCLRGLAKIHTPVFNVGMEYPLWGLSVLFRNANI